MFLQDLFEAQTVPSNRYEPRDDKTGAEENHSRKVRLTLEQINKLRRMNQVRNLEQSKQDEFFQVIYGAGAQPQQPEL